MSKKKKFYGQTFLTKQRFFTEDAEKAVKSFLVYQYNEKIKKHTSSYLGLINSFLFRIGLALVVEFYPETGEIAKTSLMTLKTYNKKVGK